MRDRARSLIKSKPVGMIGTTTTGQEDTATNGENNRLANDEKQTKPNQRLGVSEQIKQFMSLDYVFRLLFLFLISRYSLLNILFCN